MKVGFGYLFKMMSVLAHHQIYVEPPYADPHVRWCERRGKEFTRLLDFLKLN